MDYAFFKTVADTQDWLALLPEIALCVSGLLLLILDVLIPSRLNRWVSRTGVLLVVGITIAFLATGGCCSTTKESVELFGGMIRITPMSRWFRAFFLVANIGVFWLAGNYLKNRPLVRTEYYAITCFVTAAMMLLVHSNHFVVLFVALETITIGLYVLVAYDRNSEFSLEAGLKYLIVGGTNTAILLLGIALLYGIAGNASLEGSSSDPLAFENLSLFLAENQGNIIAKMGVLAVLASVAFKVGLVPFQIWIPDVYQGAPTPTTGFLAVSSKAAGFAVLLLLFGENGAFQPMSQFVLPILLVVTIASMIYGNVTALGYTNLKRLLGMSGVSHAGFIMIGILVYMQLGQVNWIGGAILFYLLAYLLASFLVFGVMSVLSGVHDEDQDLYDYSKLSEDRPFLAAVLVIGVGSLAGIPPFIGFIAKFSLFVAAYQAQLFFLLAMAVVSVVISIYYYFKWIREVYYHNPVPEIGTEDDSSVSEKFKKASLVDCIILGALAISIILLGIYPMNLLSSWSLF